MRVKIALSAVTIFFVLSIAFIPTFILSAVTKVDITRVVTQTYQNTIHCNGEIIEKRVKEIYLETPVIAQSVRVQVGDRVQKGQTLAVINTDLTSAVLAQGATATKLDEPAPSSLDLGAVVAQYGLSAEEIQSAMNLYGEAQKQEPPQAETVFVPNEITAPMDGVVTAINLQTDVLTQTAKPVLVVSDDTAYAVKVAVNEADVAQLQVGNPAVITGVGFSGQQYYGVITKIYPAAHKAISGTAQQTVVDVELSVENADNRLKPGFSAKAVIAIDQSGEMLTVPYTAVGQGEDNREYVFVYHKNRVQKRYVETGSELVNAVEIVSGLAVTDCVVTNPTDVKNEKNLAYATKGGADLK